MSRILCLIDSLGLGGAERQMACLSILLKKAGHEVQLIAFTDKIINKFYDSFLRENGIIPIYNEPGVNRFRRIWEIAKIVRKFKPNLTIAYKDGVCMSATLAKIFGNFNLAVSERSSTPKLSKLQRIKLYLFRYANHIVPNSQTQADYIRQFAPYLGSKIKVINNVIDTEFFSPNINRKNYNYKSPVILTTARVSPVKNTLNYLKAIAILKDKGIQCQFIWYGRTEKGEKYMNHISNEITSLGLSDYITFHSAVSDIAPIYQKADFFCLPSLKEGFPNVICEAMATGLPVACSNVCDNPYIVEDCINGFLFDPEDPKDIADKLILILSLSQEEIKNMGIINREKIISLCSPKIFLKNYLSLL